MKFRAVLIILVTTAFAFTSYAAENKKDKSSAVVIRAINGERVTVWQGPPSQPPMPKPVIERWNGVVPIFVTIESRDETQPIPPVLQSHSFASGYLIPYENKREARKEFYVLTVEHVFNENLHKAIEYTKYSDKVFAIKALVVTKYKVRDRKAHIEGLPLDLIKHDYDFSVFRLQVPLAIPQLKAIPESLFGRNTENGRIDQELGDMGNIQRDVAFADVNWPFIEKKFPEIIHNLKSTKPLKIGVPKESETVHVLGYVPLNEYGILPYYAQSFYSATAKNVEEVVYGKPATLKKVHILRGSAVHGLSGALAFNDEGVLVGIFYKLLDNKVADPEAGTLSFIISSEDLFEFLNENGLAHLVEK